MKRNNTCTSIYQQHVHNIDCSTHRIYFLVYLPIHLPWKATKCIGKYIIHWMVNAVLDLPFFLLQSLLWQFFRMTPGRFCEGFGVSMLLMVQKSQPNTWHVWSPVSTRYLPYQLVSRISSINSTTSQWAAQRSQRINKARSTFLTDISCNCSELWLPGMVKRWWLSCCPAT